MEDIKKIPLISSEISGLWNSYMGNSLVVCMLKYFVNRVEDEETCSILQYALDLSNQYIIDLTEFFKQAALPIPDAFNDKDVNVDAPRLYSDEFYLAYLAQVSRSEMLRYTLILSNCARSDLRDFFSKLVNDSINLYNKVANIRLAKGLFIRCPQVEVQKKVNYIESQNFFIEIVGEKRPLVVGEITHVSSIILLNIVGRALVTGFGQVSKKKEISEYMFRGRDISSKKIDIFTSVLTSENIPIPSTPYSYVTDSIVAPFSEKLMMFHITAICTTAMSYDGLAISESLRSDLQTKYMRILAEVMKYAKDGSEIMTREKWLEQPPECIEHENLSGILE